MCNVKRVIVTKMTEICPSSMEGFSVFQFIILVLWPATMLWLTLNALKVLLGSSRQLFYAENYY